MDLENYNPDHWTVDDGGGAAYSYAAVPDRQRVITLRLIHLA